MAATVSRKGKSTANTGAKNVTQDDAVRLRPQDQKKNTPNPTVYNRLKRLDLRCSICRPNKGENAKRRPEHGKTKPKYKDKR